MASFCLERPLVRICSLSTGYSEEDDGMGIIPINALCVLYSDRVAPTNGLVLPMSFAAFSRQYAPWKRPHVFVLRGHNVGLCCLPQASCWSLKLLKVRQTERLGVESLCFDGRGRSWQKREVTRRYLFMRRVLESRLVVSLWMLYFFVRGLCMIG